MLTMKKNFAAILSLSCIGLFYAAYLIAVPAIVNTKNFEDFIENNLQNKTGYKIDFVNPRLKTGIIPSVILSADEINLLNDDGGKALEITHPILKLKLLPLLFKNICISKSKFENLTANFVYDKNHRFLIGQYPIEKRNSQNFSLNDLSLDAGHYIITLKDEVQNKNIKLDGEYLTVKEYKQNKSLSFSTLSKLYTGKKISTLNADINLSLPLNKISEDKAQIDVDITDFDLSEFKEYAKTLTKNKITDLYGIVNFSSKTENIGKHKNIKSLLTLNKLGIIQKERTSSIYSNYPIKITKDLNIINDGIKINSLKIISEGIDVSVNGELLKTNEKFPTLDLKATAKNVKGVNLIPLFPGEDLNPDFDFKKLKEHTIYGTANGSIEIKGIANYPELYGSAILTDVYLKEPIKDAPQKGILKFSFNEHKMNLDAHVMTDKKEFVDVKGSFKLFRDRYSEIDIKTTQNISLPKAKKVLIPLREIFRFELGPVPMMDVPAGYGNANFKIAGSRENPHAWGEINFRNGIASFITINNMVVHNISGNVKFYGDDVAFETNSAILNNLPVHIKGKCTMKGDLSVDVNSEGQNLSDLLKIVNTSPILKELQDMLSPVTSGSGKTKLFLNIFGHVNRGIEPVFNKDLFAKGKIEFLSDKLTLFPQKIPVSNLNGTVNFNRQDGDFKLNADLVNSPITAGGSIKNNIVTANAYSNKFNAGDGWKIAKLIYKDRIPPIPGINTISTSFSGCYKGPVDLNSFDYSKITAKGKYYNNYGAKAPITVNNGDFEIKNGHLHVSQIRGLLSGNPFNLQIDVDNIVTPQQAINGTFSMKNFDLSAVNNISFPEYPELNDFEQFKGRVDIASKINNNKIRLYTKFADTSVVYKPKRIKIKVLNGNALYDNDILNLNKINGYFGEMPIFLNGKIKKVSDKNPDFDLYVNAKPTQEFFDQYFNSKSVYPIKLKGDILLTSKVNGPINRMNAKTTLKLDENSSLYYMGATIGDMTNPVNISIDSLSGKDKIMLNSFKYDKIISSQNGKNFTNTQLVAGGGIQLLKNNVLKFNNFKVKTLAPTDAKIFNIIFKKPFMKQGVFMSDLTVNGDTLNPKIQGTLEVNSIDVPIVDATVKDVNFDFKPDNIYIKAKSSVLDNSIILNGNVQNKLAAPYVINELNIHFDNLDTNVISNAMQDYDATMFRQNLGIDENTKNINQNDFIIKSGTITADKIKIQDLTASNFVSKFSADKNRILKVKNYTMSVADGTVNGDGEYDLAKTKLRLNAHIKNFNSQLLAESLFNMKGQLVGTLTGDMEFICTGNNQTDCIKTSSGKGKFAISDGRMPKLGSLEYLLKATNIVTSGITRISINNIIDLITPLKTGQFKSITGHFDINNGLVQNIEIFSKGKDLNLYLTGSYNIENYVAQMEVYGTLSANLTSVFGKLKNLSLNTLLNTIPILNNTEYSPEVTAKINKIPKDDSFSISRIFAAVIDGDINGMSYVKSFKWVK